MTTAEYTKGLREMADLLDAHPEFGVPCSFQSVSIFPNADEPKLHAASVMRSLGRCDKIYDGENFRLEKKIGVHTLWVWYQRNDICQRVVVGKEIVPAQPARTIPAQPEQEREIVEWVCSPVLKCPDVEGFHDAAELVGTAQPQLEASVDYPF